MKYPVANNKADFDRDWSIAMGFGAPTSYGFHEGVDINARTGGDTDLGRELAAIAAGKIVYYHMNSHPTINFGKHLVYKIDGPWDTRWVHYAHCLDFTPAGADVAEGQVIAKLGKSGNAVTAHLHMSVWKVDPAGYGGIDAIANSQQELNQKWEDPIAFIEKWLAAPAPTDYKKLYEELLVVDKQKDQKIIEQKSIINGFDGRISRFKNDTKNYIDGYQV